MECVGERARLEMRAKLFGRGRAARAELDLDLLAGDEVEVVVRERAVETFSRQVDGARELVRPERQREAAARARRVRRDVRRGERQLLEGPEEEAVRGDRLSADEKLAVEKGRLRVVAAQQLVQGRAHVRPARK